MNKVTKILFYDTETTWFNPPAILQFWGIIWEYQENWFHESNERKINLLINPEIEISVEASKIHGFYFNDIKNEPRFRSFAPELVSIIKDVDLIVWHNINFDNKALEFEFKRILWDNEFRLKEVMDIVNAKSFCTMLNTVDFCKIPGKFWTYKWPKLIELHKILFGKWFDWAHDAMVDITTTRNCYFELKKRKII